ncbi:dipeptide-binding ABC transporter, periplasmic substrate-binding component [Lachnospiraceae bacterium KM106-2]|nr:dipeptide-binding ABC transporter, periplasmic substrate-binding component [Lachnospiraceae bacterium KM106-2]
MKKNSLTKLALLLTVMTVALSGCSGDKSKSDSSPSPNVEDNMSQGKPTNGGSIVVGIQQDLDSLDPGKAIAAGTKEVLFNIFEGLVKPDEKGNLVPAVASKYEVSKDGKTYTFTLRDGVKFHNGNVVTAEDVVYSIKRSAGLLDKTDKSVYVDSALQNISKVEKTDDKTIVVSLKSADTELIGYMTLAIIPKDYDKQDSAPVGTGPFKFVSYKPLESFVVEKNDDYWNQDGKAYLDKVTFKIVANTDSAFTELTAGSIDIYPYLTDDQATQLKNQFNVEVGNMNLVQGLFLNNDKEPFNNEDVRKALNYAIDKQAILDMVAGGRGNILGSNMYSGYKKYFDSSLVNMYQTDAAKAKEYLTKAGYPNGFTFTITVPSNYQYHVDTAQVIVEQLKSVGITAKIQKVEWNTWLSDVYQKRNYQATIVGLDGKLSARSLLERYSSKATNNFVNYKNEEYDKVLDTAINTVDDKEKVASYKTLQKLLAEDAASVYIQDPPLLVAVNKKLGGYTFYPVYVQDMAKVYLKK